MIRRSLVTSNDPPFFVVSLNFDWCAGCTPGCLGVSYFLEGLRGGSARRKDTRAHPHIQSHTGIVPAHEGGFRPHGEGGPRTHHVRRRSPMLSLLSLSDKSTADGGMRKLGLHVERLGADPAAAPKRLS